MKKLIVLAAFLIACNAETKKKYYQPKEIQYSIATDAMLYGYAGPVKLITNWGHDAKDSLGKLILENDSMLLNQYQFDNTGRLLYLKNTAQDVYKPYGEKEGHAIAKNWDLPSGLYNGCPLKTIEKRISLTDTSVEYETSMMYYINGKDSVLKVNQTYRYLDKYCRTKTRRTMLHDNTSYTNQYYYSDNHDTCIQYTTKNNENKLSSRTIILERDSYGNPLKARLVYDTQNDDDETLISYQTWNYEYYR